MLERSEYPKRILNWHLMNRNLNQVPPKKENNSYDVTLVPVEYLNERDVSFVMMACIGKMTEIH